MDTSTFKCLVYGRLDCFANTQMKNPVLILRFCDCMCVYVYIVYCSHFCETKHLSRKFYQRLCFAKMSWVNDMQVSSQDLFTHYRKQTHISLKENLFTLQFPLASKSDPDIFFLRVTVLLSCSLTHSVYIYKY